jgi:hypothetical protein
MHARQAFGQESRLKRAPVGQYHLAADAAVPILVREGLDEPQRPAFGERGSAVAGRDGEGIPVRARIAQGGARRVDAGKPNDPPVLQTERVGRDRFGQFDRFPAGLAQSPAASDRSPAVAVVVAVAAESVATAARAANRCPILRIGVVGIAKPDG